MLIYQPRVKFDGNGTERTDWTFDFNVAGLTPVYERYGENSHSMLLLSVFWVSLLGDSPTDSFKPLSVIKKFAGKLANDATGLIKSFASIYDALTTSVIRGQNGELIIQHFVSEFKSTPIYREYLEFTRTHSAILFKYISTFLLFGKKVYYEDDSFHAAAFRDWCETERRLDGAKFDEGLLSDLSAIMDWYLRGFDDTDFLPKHGSGSTAEKGVRTIVDKNKTLQTTARIESLFKRPFILGDTVPTTTESFSKVSRQSSKLTFVPKDIGKSRSICMEPATYQYTQQGVRVWLETAIANNIGRHVPLRHQEQNQTLAKFGSKTGRVDTIDLSQASDSVHVDLVNGVFPQHVLQYLNGTRSETVEVYEGVELALSKFAPMGSALCFPVQSVLYAAVVLHASLAWRLGEAAGACLKLHPLSVYHYYNEVYADRSRYKLVPFSIYGDDIICDSRITPYVVETLSKLHFVVNERKSFVGSSAFRESCGGYYLLGEDVTPLRAKLGPIQSTMPIAVMASVIDLANRAKERGYGTLYRTCVQCAMHYPIAGVKYSPYQRCNDILFSADPDASLAIIHQSATNKHLRVRRFTPGRPSRDSRFYYQRDEIRSVCLRPERVSELSSGDEGYLHVVWWRSRLSTITDSDMPRKIPVQTGPAWRWTAHAGV